MSDAELTAAAKQIVHDISNLIGGPISTKDDAVRRCKDALRIAYLRGWDDKQRQLADAVYPR